MRIESSNLTTIHQYSTKLYEEIKPIWEKANIPMVDKQTCMYRIMKLLSSWVKKRCRDMRKESDEEVAYISMLDSLCSMTYPDLETIKCELKRVKLFRGECIEGGTTQTWEVDFNFLINQMKNPQIGSMDGKDKILSNRVENKLEKDTRRKYRKDKERLRSKTRFKTLTETELDESLGIDEGEHDASAQTEPDLGQGTSTSDPDYIPTRRIRNPKKLDKIMLELPTKDLMKDTASLCARLRISQRAATSLYAKIILSGGGDLKDFVISKSSTFRHRILAEKETEAKMKLRFNELTADNPYAILHWDGKIVKFQSKVTEDHLVICLQHVSSGTQPQFVSAPQTPNGTGVAECEAVVRYIDQLKIEDQIIGHVWDTTPSNTGRHSGVAILLDKALERANLWLGCRRHSSERHIVHANEVVCGKTSNPEDPLFKRFKEMFDQLDTTDLHTFSWDGDEVSLVGPYKFATERALAVKEWAEQCCIRGSFPREDYRELLELITHMLGGTIKRRSEVNKEAPPRVVQFNMLCPGTIHHARFMAKAIYYRKMFMTLPQLLQKDIVTDVQASQI